MMNDMIENPFGDIVERKESGVAAEQGRAMQEVMAMMLVAQRAPRSEAQSMNKILAACTRLKLAESAQYAFPRGGQLVEGPSIRLAEVIAQSWQHLQYGIRELGVEVDASGEPYSNVEAFAWDLQNNVRESRQFRVPHVRVSREGGRVRLTDPRDVYEMVANQGMRRVRACVLAIVPGDVVDAACQQCDATISNKGGAAKEQLAEIVKAFERFNVKQSHIEARLRHDLDATIMAEVIQLRKIFVSLRDGMSSPAQWFEGVDAPAGPQQSDLADGLKTSKKKTSKKTSKKKPQSGAGASESDAGERRSESAPAGAFEGFDPLHADLKGRQWSLDELDELQSLLADSDKEGAPLQLTPAEAAILSSLVDEQRATLDGAS